MRYQKPYKVEIHIHLENEKSSFKKELLIAVISGILTELIIHLLG